ncbi:uncharacterized protein METZ01_LOCUS322662, partial [marine metagenome]
MVVIEKNRYMKQVKVLALCFLCMFTFFDIVEGQTGRLTGRVRDEQGVTLERAEARVINPSSDEVVAVTSTDDLGFFELEELPVGLIRLEIQRLGFQLFSQEFELGATERQIIDIELRIQAL